MCLPENGFVQVRAPRFAADTVHRVGGGARQRPRSMFSRFSGEDTSVRSRRQVSELDNLHSGPISGRRWWCLVAVTGESDRSVTSHRGDLGVYAGRSVVLESETSRTERTDRSERMSKFPAPLIWATLFFISFLELHCDSTTFCFAEPAPFIFPPPFLAVKIRSTRQNGFSGSNIFPTNGREQTNARTRGKKRPVRVRRETTTASGENFFFSLFFFFHKFFRATPR